MSDKHKIAARAAADLLPGQVINVGIGLPALILQHLSPDAPVMVHSENGVLGMNGHTDTDNADPMLIDAGGDYVSVVPGASYFDSATSFAIIRSGRLDVAFLGTLEVAANGDLANWIIPGKFAPGIGGGMELAAKARKTVVMTTHCTRKGAPKILTECTLPLTAKQCVDRIITELAVMDVTDDGLVLRELADGVTVDDIRDKTDADFTVAEGTLPRF